MKTIPLTRITTTAWTLLALLGFSAPASAETVRIYFDPATPQIAFAAGDIEAALEKGKHTVETHNLAALSKAVSGKEIVLAVASDKNVAAALSAQGGKPVGSLGEQAYALRTTTKPDVSYWVLDGDAVGAMYGGLQLAENITFDGLSGSYDETVSPDFLQRGVKLNLPMDTQGSWGLDAHWYAEASLYPENRKGFRYLDDFIATKTAKTSSSDLCSIADSAAGKCGTKKSTYQLADEMEADAQSALALINGISRQGNPDLEVKINNIKQLAYLSTHFGYKIRAATYKSANQIPSARDAMGMAYCWWMKYVNSMDAMYKGNKFRTVDIEPDWHYADAWQLKDYTDLGGVGIPSCETKASK